MEREYHHEAEGWRVAHDVKAVLLLLEMAARPPPFTSNTMMSHCKFFLVLSTPGILRQLWGSCVLGLDGPS